MACLDIHLAGAVLIALPSGQKAGITTEGTPDEEQIQF
jgi:hypothetical protein